MLYIMRHGTTEWNVLHKLQGRTDVPLNDAGRELARRAAEEYRDVHFDICFCSPLIRARETAGILLEGRNVPVVPDNRLMEMSFGEYEGMDYSFDTPDGPMPDSPINVIFVSPENYTGSVGGSEPFSELFARTGEFLREKVYPLLDEGKDVLIVGHGALDSSIICQVKNIPVADFWKAGIENCKLKKLL